MKTEPADFLCDPGDWIAKEQDDGSYQVRWLCELDGLIHTVSLLPAQQEALARDGHVAAPPPTVSDPTAQLPALREARIGCELQLDIAKHRRRELRQQFPYAWGGRYGDPSLN